MLFSLLLFNRYIRSCSRVIGVNCYVAIPNSFIDFTGKDTFDAVKGLSELPPSRELELPPTAGAPARRLVTKLGLDIGRDR